MFQYNVLAHPSGVERLFDGQALRVVRYVAKVEDQFSIGMRTEKARLSLIAAELRRSDALSGERLNAVNDAVAIGHRLEVVVPHRRDSSRLPRERPRGKVGHHVARVDVIVPASIPLLIAIVGPVFSVIELADSCLDLTLVLIPRVARAFRQRCHIEVVAGEKQQRAHHCQDISFISNDHSRIFHCYFFLLLVHHSE